MIVLLLGLILILPQEDPKVRKLIEMFSSEDIVLREAAALALIDMGPPIVPSLRKAAESADSEVRQRASDTIARIERNVRIAKFYPDRKPFPLRFVDTPLEEVLQELSQKTQTKLSAGTDLKRNVTVSLEQGTLLQALDEVCKNLGDLKWTVWKDGEIKLIREAFIDRPAFYAGAFKIQITRMDALRSTDFKEGTGHVTITFDAQAERGTQVPAGPLFTIKEVMDDTGAVLTSDPRARNQMLRLRRMGVVGPQEGTPFTFRGLAKGARKISSISGSATFLAPLQTTTLSLEELKKGAKKEVGDFTLQIDEVQKHYLQGSILKTRGTIDLERQFDPASIVILDAHGNEHKSQPGCFQLNRLTANSLSFYCTDPQLLQQAATMKLELVTESYEKEVPFELKDIPLP